MRECLAVGIVGGGFTGAVAAVHLLRGARIPLDVTLFEPRTTPGAGLAYSSMAPDHRINGPIDILSIFPHDIGHFSRWYIESGEAEADPEALAQTGQFYCRRSVFGHYMAEMIRLHRAKSAARFRHVEARVDDIEIEDDGYRVIADGISHRCNFVLFCLGHEKPAVPRALQGLIGHAGFVADPWSKDALDAIDREADVALLGSGLTAVDVVASLRQRGHRGRMIAISRRGLLPRPQGVLPPVAGRLKKLFRATPAFIERHGTFSKVSSILRAVRSDIDAIQRNGGTWQDAFDDLRDAAPYLWKGLDSDKRRRALRHLQVWYDVHRFRMAPQLWRILQEARDETQFETLRGRLVEATPAPGGDIDLTISTRSAQTELRMRAMVNCTGPSADPSRSANPLVTRLLESGIICVHPTGVGISIDDACRALGPSGRAQQRLRVFGVLSRGHVGDLIAVPQINAQVLRVLDDAGLTA